MSSSSVPLSFSYPKTLPLIKCGEEWVSELLKYEEYITFSKNCDYQYQNEYYGYIVVTKIPRTIKNPTDLLDKQDMLGNKYKYDEVRIGNEWGYMRNVDPTLLYYVFSKGYQYEIEIQKSADFPDKITNNLIKSFRF